jgi:imidazolonepropionase-like amidohydrolase
MVVFPGAKGDSVGLRITDFERDKPLLDRHIAEQQPDFLKLTYDAQGYAGTAAVPLMPLPLLRRIARHYGLHGIRTLVHVTHELRATEAIFAGADGLAHPVEEGPVTEDFVRLMAVKKMPFATTFAIGDNYGRLVEHPEFLDRADYAMAFSADERRSMKTELRERFRASVWTGWHRLMLPVYMDNVARIVKAGGVAALGTDQSSGPAAHREMQLLIAAGLTPLQVIQAATYNAALLIGQAERIGSVEPGKFADLVLLNADPAADIENTSDIALVMKAGKIIDESRLPLAGGPQRKRFATMRD